MMKKPDAQSIARYLRDTIKSAKGSIHNLIADLTLLLPQKQLAHQT